MKVGWATWDSTKEQHKRHDKPADDDELAADLGGRAVTDEVGGEIPNRGGESGDGRDGEEDPRSR